MIGLLPISRVIVIIAVFYATVCALLFGGAIALMEQPQTTWKAATFALSGSTILHFVLMAWIYFGWRCFWRWFPSLGRLVYPDIEGVWEMEINWNGSGKKDSGTVQARAVIRQNFLRLSMDVTSERSTSTTFMASPKKHAESGHPILYYIYSVTTKAEKGTQSKTYQGTVRRHMKWLFGAF